MDTDHSLTSSEGQSPKMDRRAFMKTVGAAGATATVGASGVGPVPEPVGESEAFLPAAAAVVAGVGVAGALGAFVESKYNVLGSDAPPDSLGPEALKDQVVQAVKTRKSTNASTLTDNQNLITYVEEPAFVSGKIAAVKAINNEKTKANVESAALLGANAHITTVEKNLLNSWNESVNELSTMVNNLNSAGVSDFLKLRESSNSYRSVGTDTVQITLSDGSTFQVNEIVDADFANYGYTALGVNDPDDVGSSTLSITADSQSVEYLSSSVWEQTWSELQTAQNNVTNNLVTWVDTAYNQVQSGSLNPDNLLSPTDLADSYAGENSRAIADLQALNIPNAGDNEAVIKVTDNYSSRMTGLLASSDGTVGNLSAGDTVDPSTSSGDWYMSHDLGKWTAEVTRYYNQTYGIQGGQIRATRNPQYHYGTKSTGVSHIVETSQGETAEIPTSDFEEKLDENNNPYWSTNISGKLSQSTTDIAKVTAVTTGEQSGVYRTEQMTDPFEVVETSNGELSFEPPREPQTDSNYLTEEEWDNLEQNTQENIEAYEESQSENILGSNPLGGSGLPTLPGLGLAQSLVVVVLGVLGISILTD